MNNTIPDGYKQDSVGRLVPIEDIESIDLLRDDTVQQIAMRAKALRDHVMQEKTAMLSDLRAFLESSFEQHGVRFGGKKGNVTLSSYDGSLQVQLAVHDRISFNEKLQAAKELVDQCVLRWSEGANAHIRTLVQHAFQTDKEGKINTGRVLSLMRVNIDDAQWKAAMEAVKDSLTIADTKEYVRISERPARNAKHQQIVLDFSALEV
jgi:hypothetical protein